MLRAAVTFVAYAKGAARRGTAQGRPSEDDMTRFISATALACTVALTLAIGAPATRADDPAAKQYGTIREDQAILTTVGPNTSAVVYWEKQKEAWQVVTTVDVAIAPNSEAETHAVVRFAAELLPGQSQLISVPVATGAQQQVLRISRVGDRIEVARVLGSSTSDNLGEIAGVDAP
jgi:hypothetical protein